MAMPCSTVSVPSATVRVAPDPSPLGTQNTGSRNVFPSTSSSKAGRCDQPQGAGVGVLPGYDSCVGHDEMKNGIAPITRLSRITVPACGPTRTKAMDDDSARLEVSIVLFS